MSDHVATVAKRTIKTQARWKQVFWSFAPIVTLVTLDLVLSVVAFVLAYKFRHDADLFVWKRRFFFPVRLADEFLPYLSLLFFVPVVKGLALRRFGLFRLRGEFSFSDDFIRVLKASTLSFLVLVLIAILFRQ